MTSGSTRDGRRPFDGWVIGVSAIIGVAACLVIRARLGQWNSESFRECLQVGTNRQYCRNIQQYPAVLQWIYAGAAGWIAFFAAWIAYTVYPRAWARIL